MASIDTTKPHIEQDEKPVKKLSDKHLALARRGAELSRTLKDSKKELDEINAQFKKDIDVGCSIVLPGEWRIPVYETASTAINDAEELKVHLGTRKFNQVVEQKVTFKPSPTLLNMAESDTHIDAMLIHKTSTTVKYLALKTKS